MSTNGYCQVCGWYGKITKAGTVPQHGRGHHHFREVCPGSKSAPLLPPQARPEGTPPATDRIEALYAKAREEGNLSACERYARRLIDIRKSFTNMPFKEQAEIEGAEAELMLLLRKIGHLFWLVTATEKYGSCRHCGKPVDAETYKFAVRRFEKQLCSDECRRAEHIKLHACCDKATPSPCVCTYSFSCPEHGNMHVGTHD